MSTHIGQGIAKRLGEVYTAPDRDELARRAALREAQEREARRASLAETEEGERRTLAKEIGQGAAMRSYYEQGGRARIRWVVEPVPLPEDDDPIAGIDGNGPARRINGSL
jgi:hypothetical protein